MKLFHRERKIYIDVNKDQFEFIIDVLEMCGDIPAVKAKRNMTDALLKEYQSDQLFWSYVMDEVELAARASRLTPDYIKDFVRASMDPTSKVTGTQIQAAALAARICGMWNNNGVSRTKVEITPQNMSITFEDGLQAIPAPKPPENPATGQPGPAVPAIEYKPEAPNGQETNP